MEEDIIIRIPERKTGNGGNMYYKYNEKANMLLASSKKENLEHFCGKSVEYEDAFVLMYNDESSLYGEEDGYAKRFVVWKGYDAVCALLLGDRVDCRVGDQKLKAWNAYMNLSLLEDSISNVVFENDLHFFIFPHIFFVGN